MNQRAVAAVAVVEAEGGEEDEDEEILRVLSKAETRRSPQFDETLGREVLSIVVCLFSSLFFAKLLCFYFYLTHFHHSGTLPYSTSQYINTFYPHHSSYPATSMCSFPLLSLFFSLSKLSRMCLVSPAFIVNVDTID